MEDGTAAEADRLQPLSWPITPNHVQTFDQLVLTAPSRSPLDPARFVRPGIITPVRPQEAAGSYTGVSTWPPYSLDDILASGVARWWEAYAPWYKLRR
jgi:hypothetical protein